MHMDTTARKWLGRTARRNLWRVYGWYDLDDLVADGALCWQIVIRKYPEVTKRRHMMALFQRTYINHINKLSNQRSKQAVEFITDVVHGLFANGEENKHNGVSIGRIWDGRDKGVPHMRQIGPQEIQKATTGESDDLHQFIAESPALLRDLLSAIVDNPKLLMRQSRRALGSHRRETTNEYLCGLIGVDPKTYDLHSGLLSLLGPLKERDMA